MNTDQLLLIDFSSLARPMWEACKNSEERSNLAPQIVARVHAIALAHPHAAVCMDSGKSFRHDIDPTYKGQRPESEAAMIHQFDVAADALKRDGFVVWKVRGFEADDLVASATTHALAIDETSVLIASSDKDLLCLVNGRVSVKSLRNGTVLDSEAVIEKFGVQPFQMLDYLSLVGDASDNIKGAKGIGAVRAVALLKKYGTLDAVFAAFDKGATPDITPQQRTDLQEFRARRDTVRSLIQLRTDVEIPFAEIAAERVPQEMDSMEDEPNESYDMPNARPNIEIPTLDEADKGKPYPNIPKGEELTAEQATAELGKVAERVAQRIELNGIEKKPLPVEHAPVSWDQQLEPRSMPEAITLAKHMFASRMFSAYGTGEAVLSTILAGRELGMPAMVALRSFHIIEGKPTLSAGAIQALVLKSGKAKYFRCTERTDERATFQTQRGDDPPMTLTFTIADGKAAWSKDEAAWKKSGWGRNPADMCVARAGSKLARLVYPDVVAGLYDPSEVE